MAEAYKLPPATPVPPFSRQLHDNYRSAVYVCQNYRLLCGTVPPDFQDFLFANGWHNFTFVTAYNPFSVPGRSLVENQADQQHLERLLVNRGLPFLPASAEDPSGKWPVEPGVFVFDASLPLVLHLGLRFGQNAVYRGDLRRTSRVLWCHGVLREGNALGEVGRALWPTY